MTIDQFQQYLYKQTGEMIEGSLLENYYNDSEERFDDYDEEIENTNTQTHRSTINGFKNYNFADKYDYDDDDNVATVVRGIFNKIKINTKRIIDDKREDTAFIATLNELVFNFKVFLAKSLLYVIVTKGSEEGFSHKDF